jgi:hypothetical protein
MLPIDAPMLDELRRHIHGAPSMLLASSNDERRPAITRVVGAMLDDDGTHVRLMLAKPVASPTIDNVRRNPRVAFTACHLVTFETYQLKGVIVASDDASPAELAIKDIFLTKFVAAMASKNLPPTYLANMTRLRDALSAAPAYALRLEIHEVFSQTPGPNAGCRLWAKES